MLTACGDDSSSASSEAVESSSSVAVESSSDWAHENVGEYYCYSKKDSVSQLKYVFDGPDSATEVTSYEYPKVLEDVEKVCEEAKVQKTDEQKVTCDSFVEIINPSKTMEFDSLKVLMKKECKASSIMNIVDFTNPDEAPENAPCGPYPKNPCIGKR